MKKWTGSFLIFILIIACNNKKKEIKDTSSYFPVRSFLQNQVSELDSSLFRFIKIETKNGIADTNDISREEATRYAGEFLAIPDITNPELGSDYTEMSNYDSAMGRVIMSYTAYDKKDVEVVKQDVTVLPGFGAVEDEVKTIYIEKISSDNDIITEKKMLWNMDRFFHIRTIKQDKNSPEQVHDIKIVWNASQWDN